MIKEDVIHPPIFYNCLSNLVSQSTGAGLSGLSTKALCTSWTDCECITEQTQRQTVTHAHTHTHTCQLTSHACLWAGNPHTGNDKQNLHRWGMTASHYTTVQPTLFHPHLWTNKQQLTNAWECLTLCLQNQEGHIALRLFSVWLREDL